MKDLKEKIIKAWAIMPLSPDHKKLGRFPFLDGERCYLIYSTKRWANEYNGCPNKKVVKVEIKIK